MGKRIALLIGNTTYTDSAKFPLLTRARADVNQFAQFLQRYCGFEIQGTLINKKCEDTKKAIEDLYQSVDEGDLTLLYFSGHGFRNANPLKRRFYMVAPDTSVKNIEATSIPENYISTAMESSECNHHIVILDCCYSAAFITKGEGDQDDTAKPVELFDDLTGKMKAVLASSSSDKLSYEGSGETSLFTRYLMEGVKTGLADQDKDGEVGIDEFFNFAKRKVKEKFPLQKPVIGLNPLEDFPTFAWVNAPFKPSSDASAPPIRVKSIPEAKSASASMSSRDKGKPEVDNSGCYAAIFLVVIILVLFWKPISSSISFGSITTPDGFVRAYYARLGEGKYQEAWNMLSPVFIARFGTGYGFDDYRTFWNGIQAIEIRTLNVVRNEDTQAILQAHLYYRLKSGKVDDDPNFCLNLTRGAKGEAWMIDATWYAQDCTVGH